MPDQTPLRIRLVRRPDHAVVLELRRADGSSTGERRDGPTAEFFALHDLTHYAVETTLGVARGFYGLVAEGWSLHDFGRPWPRGPLPHEALAVETLVGCLDVHRSSGVRATAAECNAACTMHLADRDTTPILLDEAQAGAINVRFAELAMQWRAVPDGGALELDYPMTYLTPSHDPSPP